MKMSEIINVVEDVVFYPTLSTGVSGVDFEEAEALEAVPGDVLFVEQAAVHANRLSANLRFFTEECLRKSLSTWTKDYAKPILTNHNLESDPLGRVVSASVEKEGKHLFHKIMMGIIDYSAIQKVMDGRYNTGSVGGKGMHVVCSICGEDLVLGGLPVTRPCKHMIGETYKNKLAYMVYNDIEWREYSFVNVPADTLSKKISARYADADEAEAFDDPAPRYFYIPRKEEKVVAFEEGETISIDVSESDDALNGIYLGFREMAEQLWDEARLEVSANPESMEVTRGVQQSNAQQIVTEEDVEEIVADVHALLMSKITSQSSDEESNSPAEVEEEVWNQAYINSLPDAAFALVKRPVKEKAADRALPHHSKGVTSATDNKSVDKPHLANALSRANQVKGFSAGAKARAVGHLKKHASALGVGEDDIVDLLERGEAAFAEYLEREGLTWVPPEEELQEEVENENLEDTKQEVTEENPSSAEGEEGCTEVTGEKETNQVEEEETVPGEEEAVDEEAQKPAEEAASEEAETETSEDEDPSGDKVEEGKETAEEADPNESDEGADPGESEESTEDPATIDEDEQETAAENSRLRDQNLKLVEEIHFLLAERVVDEMLRRGMIDESQQASELDDHLKRTIASLKDKLSDILKDEPKTQVAVQSKPDLKEELESVETNEPSDVEDKTEEDEPQEEERELTLADGFTDFLRPRTYGEYLERSRKTK